jgi:hypothetical protein
MTRFLASAAALCVAGMFALTPAQAAGDRNDGMRNGASQAGEWEVSDQRRRYRRHYHRRYYAPRRYYRPYYAPYYAYPRPYYRPYYHRPAPFPFFFGW